MVNRTDGQPDKLGSIGGQDCARREQRHIDTSTQVVPNCRSAFMYSRRAISARQSFQ